MPIRPCKSTMQTAIEACELLSEPHKNNRTRIDGKVQAEGQTKGKREDKSRESGRTAPRKAKERNVHRRYQHPESVRALKHAAIHPFPALRVCRARVYPSDYVFFAVTSVTRGEERDWKKLKKIDEFRAHKEKNEGCDSVWPSKQVKNKTHKTEFQRLISIRDRCDSKKVQNSCTYAYARERVRG